MSKAKEEIKEEVKEEAAKPEGTKPEAVATASPCTFRVSLGEQSAEIEARDENEAWAVFCDQQKSWPGPKVAGRKVERIG